MKPEDTEENEYRMKQAEDAQKHTIAGKRFLNPCFIALPFIILLAVIVMKVTMWCLEERVHTVPDEYLETAQHGTLWLIKEVKQKDSNLYYQIAQVDDSNEIIAFELRETELDSIRYGQNSYYPEAYWSGEYRIEDLSEYFEDETVCKKTAVYDITAYKGYEGYLGRGLGLALILTWIAEVEFFGIIFLLDLFIGIVVQILHKKKSAKK